MVAFNRERGFHRRKPREALEREQAESYHLQDLQEEKEPESKDTYLDIWLLVVCLITLASGFLFGLGFWLARPLTIYLLGGA